MKKLLNNKKGFTLVELLAVIVILALIMSIAIVSMTGIMQGARESTFKETASQIIAGVRSQLTLSMETVTQSSDFYSDGVDYFFEESIIEKGGHTSPLGGNISYATSSGSGVTVVGAKSGTTFTKIGSMGIWRASQKQDTCNGSINSYVRVKYNSTTKNLEYSICLTAGSKNKYIDVNGTGTAVGTEVNLLGNSTDMIKTSTV